MLYNSIKLKRKILNYFLINGKKQNCENTILKTMKCIQKSNNQSFTKIIQLSILNTTPIFRIIKLKRKKKKKKKGVNSVKEIPSFLSNKTFRTSKALKLLITAIPMKVNTQFSDQLKTEIVSNSQYNGSSKDLKNELQKQALQNKKFFKRYRW